jgi:hypothetical protein
MIKQIAWNTFKNTGDINTFMELQQLKNIEQNIKTEQYKNENLESKWNSNSRKNGGGF